MDRGRSSRESGGKFGSRSALALKTKGGGRRGEARASSAVGTEREPGALQLVGLGP